jgi:predicted RNA-binding Zn ribbon-like protein
VSSTFNKEAIEKEADLLVSFVNTRDIEEQTDSIGEPAALAAWIDRQTGEQVATPDQEGQARIYALREALRGLMRANNGLETIESELEPLREAAERSRFRTVISAAGEVEIVPARADLSGFEARLVLALERLQASGAWPRVKACTEETCQWAFFDTTRNRSRTWCAMEVCGNREKTRRYRSKRGSPGRRPGT